MGPYTPQAAGGAPDMGIEQAMGEAVAPSRAIIGVDTPQVSTRQSPGVQSVQPPQLMAPEFAWQPSQADLGQADVAQIRVDGNVVPVAQMRLPYGAVASRNAAIAQRRQELAAAKQKTAASFDPTKGVDDPYAAYLPEWGRFLNSDLQRMVKGRADSMHGGDMGEAWSYYSTDPEGQMEMRMWANEAGSVARHSAAMGKRAEGALGKMQQGKLQAYMPEVYNNIAGVLNATDPATGIPFRAESLSDFNLKLRDAELAISQAEFTDTYLKEIDALAAQGERLMDESGKPLVKRLPGNHYLIPKEEITSFENIRDTYAETMADMGMFDGYKDRDKAVVKAKNFLDRILKDRVKYDEKVYAETFSPERTAKASAGEGASEPSVEVSVVTNPDGMGGYKETAIISPWQETGDKPHRVAKALINTPKGEVDVYAPSLFWNDDGKFMLRGTVLDESAKFDMTKAIKSGRFAEGEEGWSDERREMEYVTSNKIGRLTYAAAANNSGEMKKMYGTSDPYEIVARQLREKGSSVDAAFIRKEWSDPEFRSFVTDKLK